MYLYLYLSSPWLSALANNVFMPALTLRDILAAAWGMRHLSCGMWHVACWQLWQLIGLIGSGISGFSGCNAALLCCSFKCSIRRRCCPCPCPIYHASKWGASVWHKNVAIKAQFLLLISLAGTSSVATIMECVCAAWGVGRVAGGGVWHAMSTCGTRTIAHQMGGVASCGKLLVVATSCEVASTSYACEIVAASTLWQPCGSSLDLPLLGVVVALMRFLGVN